MENKKTYKSKYNWKEIDEYYFSGHTLDECMSEFSFTGSNLWYARKVGKSNIPFRPYANKKVLSEMLKYGVREDTSTLKRKLVNEGILAYECAICAISEWLGEQIMLQLDHIDGDRLNNNLSNLRLLCPNCHSQTPTYCMGVVGRNTKSRFSMKNRLKTSTT